MDHQSVWFRAIKKATKVRGESIVRFIEDDYRLIIVAFLWLHIAVHWAITEVNVPLLGATCVYSGYVALIHGILRRGIAYSTDKNRLLRTFVDAFFALVFVALTRGVESPGFGLLLVPAFFASYRYAHGTANLIILALSVNYVFVCALVTRDITLHFFTRVIANVAILVLVWFSNRFSRMVLLERMRWADSVSDINPKEANLNTLAEKICAALDAEMCLVFAGRQGSYDLVLREVPHGTDDSEYQASQRGTLQISLSARAVDDMVTKAHNLRLDSSEDKAWLFDKSLQDVCEIISLGNSPITSVLGTAFHFPYDNSENVVLVINKVRRGFRRKMSYHVQDFRREDRYLLSFVIDRMLSAILLHLQKADAETFRAMVDEGVADEICTINEDHETTSINKVKRDFFRLDESAIGKKCYWLYHRREAPCENCRSEEAFRTDDIVPWQKRYNHPVSGRPYIASIKAKRIQNRKGQYEVMETVHDVTEATRYGVLTDFVLSLQQDSTPTDERGFARKVANLFGKLGFERARFYEYEADKERFIYLSSYGHSDDLGYRRFSFPTAGDQVSGWMYSQRDRSWLPAIIRLARTQHDGSYNNQLRRCEIRYTVDFPHKQKLKKEKVTEQLDLPIVYGGKLLGKISVDNYSEESDREVFRFDETDLVVAHVCSRIVGYIWESARKERFDEYIQALEHEIIEPLHIIGGHADFVLRYFDERSIPRKRKRLKLTDITQHVALLSVVVRGARIEMIKREDYTIEEVDFFKDIVLKAIAHIRGYYATKNNVDIQHSETSFMRIRMKVDRAKFELVFYNLLINAVKYADPGSTVWVRTTLKESFYFFDIEDQGIPIPEEEEEKIFRKFHRAPGGKDRDPDGTGLGLFVARLVVENHGGHLYVSSRENPTTFTVKLPTSLCC